jgi:hypothetical protein
MANVEKSTDEVTAKELGKLQAVAVECWKADQTSAEELGAALVAVKANMAHGEYTKWLKKEKIDRNRANYCTRLVEKAKKKSREEKKPHPIQAARTNIADNLAIMYKAAKTGLVVDVERAASAIKSQCDLMVNAARLQAETIKQNAQAKAEADKQAAQAKAAKAEAKKQAAQAKAAKAAKAEAKKQALLEKRNALKAVSKKKPLAMPLADVVARAEAAEAGAGK